MQINTFKMTVFNIISCIKNNLIIKIIDDFLCNIYIYIYKLYHYLNNNDIILYNIFEKVYIIK